MTTELFSMNILAWSVQMALLIAAGGLACFLFRLTQPRPRLLFLQALLVLCLLLPALRIRHPVPLPSATRVTIIGQKMNVRANEPGASLGVTDVIAAVIVAGAGLRLGWLALGVLRLRRLRKRAWRAELPYSIIALRQDLRCFAEFRISADVAGPVTFGLRRPTILLPANFTEASGADQQAIICHELVHVRRKDFFVTLAEELIRALLWFHPGVWWLLARIQLAREEVVDHEAITHTRDSDAYINALLAMAGHMIQADVAPAPLFLARRHLAKRIASIQKGARMSVRRIVTSLAGAVPLLAAAAILGWQSFPLTAAPQLEPSDSPGVEVTDSGYKLLHRSSVSYPREALDSGIVGDVVASLTLDEKGDVADARIVSGPPALRSAVLRSVLQWRFDPGQPLPSERTIEVTVRFTPPPPEGAPTPPLNPNMQRFTIRAIDLSGVPPALHEKVAAALKQYEGRELTPEELPIMESTLRNIDRDLSLNPSFDPNGAAMLAPRLSTADSSMTPKRIRVGSAIQAANLIRKVVPVYPPLARQARIQGTVRFSAVIGTDGRVKELQLISGHPVLIEAARDAVQQWLYRPTLLNGNPVEVVTTVDVLFSLSDGEAAPAATEGAFRVGDVDAKPELTYKTDPDYSEEARKARLQGTVVLATVVDQNGVPEDVRVVRPLGSGLDQKAIEAVEKWRFRPGMKDGHPVRVAATIEVNFSLPTE